MERGIYRQRDPDVPTITEIKGAQAFQNTGLMPYFYHYRSTEVLNNIAHG